MMSWLISNSIDVKQRERLLITVAGVIPDIDGIGIVIDIVNKWLGHNTDYWGQFHHQLHCIGFCLFISIGCCFLTKANRVKVAIVAFVVFHLHLVCDLIGGRGPDGYQWPIPYWLPFSSQVSLTWQGQWALNSWPNIVIGILLLLGIVAITNVKYRSPFELLSSKMDTAFVNLITRKSD
jgi:inner membrane protein